MDKADYEAKVKACREWLSAADKAFKEKYPGTDLGTMEKWHLEWLLGWSIGALYPEKRD